jgi:hypothetical protein
MTASQKILLAVKEHENYILSETLSVSIDALSSKDDLSQLGVSEENISIQEIDDSDVVISLMRRQS